VKFIRPFIVVFLALLPFTASSVTFFVDLNCTNPVPPYADWSTAATTIQDAVDEASDGDVVLVTNGVYNTGGYSVNSLSQSNRVAVTKPLTVRSVNGPTVTAIEGYHAPESVLDFNGARCVYLTAPL
jgi:hypothetical protein